MPSPSKASPVHASSNQIAAEMARRCLKDFVAEAWKVIKPEIPFVPNWHIDAICEHLEAVTRAEIRKLVICVPPDYGKSSIVAVCWPAWTWLEHPGFDWLFSSYSGTRAISDSVDCRRIIESGWYRSHWGDLFRLTSDQNQKSRFENDKSGKRMAIGLLGAGTGEHADAVVCDDPHNIRDQWSPKALQSALDTWDQVMTQRIKDPQTSRHVIIMQRLHYNDLAGHSFRQGGYEHLVLPAQYDPKRSTVTSIGWEDPRTKRDELLWKGRFDQPEIKDIKLRLGTRGFNAQQQQDPSQEEGGILKREWWRYYGVDPEDLVIRMDEIIQSWDMAFKNLETSSKVAGHVWGIRGANRFLLDRVCEHMDFIESLHAVERMTEKWPTATAKVIEDKANGPAVINALSLKITGLIPWPPKGRRMDSKVARAMAMQPELEAGNVWLPDPRRYPWVEEFVSINAEFPGGTWDDDTDAASQASDYFRQRPPIQSSSVIEDIFSSGRFQEESYWKRLS